MTEIDFDLEKNQKALRALYTAFQTHQKFWDAWLSDRLGPTRDFFAPSDEERGAATALGEALRDIALEQRDCDNCAITGLLCPIRNNDSFTFPCPHWKPLEVSNEAL